MRRPRKAKKNTQQASIDLSLIFFSSLLLCTAPPRERAPHESEYKIASRGHRKQGCRVGVQTTIGCCDIALCECYAIIFNPFRLCRLKVDMFCPVGWWCRWQRASQVGCVVHSESIIECSWLFTVSPKITSLNISIATISSSFSPFMCCCLTQWTSPTRLHIAYVWDWTRLSELFFIYLFSRTISITTHWSAPNVPTFK